MVHPVFSFLEDTSLRQGLVSFDLSQSPGATFCCEIIEVDGGFGGFFFTNELRTLVENEVFFVIFCVYIYIHLYIYIYMYIMYTHEHFI